MNRLRDSFRLHHHLFLSSTHINHIMKRYGLYIVAGIVSGFDDGGADVCNVRSDPRTVYTLFDNNTILDEVYDCAIQSNDSIVLSILNKHRLTVNEVDIIG